MPDVQTRNWKSFSQGHTAERRLGHDANPTSVEFQNPLQACTVPQEYAIYFYVGNINTDNCKDSMAHVIAESMSRLEKGLITLQCYVVSGVREGSHHVNREPLV